MPGKAKYEFDTQLSARLYKLTINRSTSASSNSKLLETLDESDESHYDPPSADISNQESSKATEIEIEDDDGEFDALESIKNGTFRDHSKNKPVHANIVNTGFATLERPDGSIQVVSKQTLCWFLEEKTWKRSSDRKFRFQSSPAGFYQIKKKPKKVEKITLETGHWAVFGTEDGKNYRLGQVLALVAIKSNSFVSECRGDETIDIGALCHWLDFERKKGKLTGNLIRTSMFNNGYYPCKYYKCSCPTPKQVKVDGQLCLTFNQSIVSQLSAFFRV